MGRRRLRYAPAGERPMVVMILTGPTTLAGVTVVVRMVSVDSVSGGRWRWCHAQACGKGSR